MGTKKIYELNEQENQNSGGLSIMSDDEDDDDDDGDFECCFETSDIFVTYIPGLSTSFSWSTA